MTRAELCVAACEGIPDSVLVGGPQGLKSWLCGRLPELDTPIPIADFGRYLPVRRCRNTIQNWIAVGIRRRDGLVVRLRETTGTRGERCVTLEDYYRMQLRVDGRQIVTIQKVMGGRLCMAVCSLCEAWLKFVEPEHGVREQILEGHGWQRGVDDYWVCKQCKGPE